VPTYTAHTAALARRNAGAPQRQDRQGTHTSVRHHAYRGGDHMAEDRFVIGTLTGQPVLVIRESKLGQAVPARRTGKLARDWAMVAAKAAPLDRYAETVLERHDSSARPQLMVASTEIRKPIVMSFTGKKAARNQDATGEAMKAGIAKSYGKMHAKGI
jgi:hypothetical protein